MSAADATTRRRDDDRRRGAALAERRRLLRRHRAAEPRRRIWPAPRMRPELRAGLRDRARSAPSPVAAALHRRRRTGRDGATRSSRCRRSSTTGCRPGRIDVGFLGRRAGRPLRQPQHHRDRRLRASPRCGYPAPAARRRSPPSCRRGLRDPAAAPARLRRAARLPHHASATATGQERAAAWASAPTVRSRAGDRPGVLRAGPETNEFVLTAAPSRRHRDEVTQQRPAGMLDSPSAPPGDRASDARRVGSFARAQCPHCARRTPGGPHENISTYPNRAISRRCATSAEADPPYRLPGLRRRAARAEGAARARCRTTLSELTGPLYGDDADRRDRQRPHAAARRRAARRADHRQRAACSTSDGRPLRGTRWSRSGRPTPRAATVHAVRPAPRAARPELHRRRALPHRRRRAATGSSRSSPARTRGATTPTPGGRRTSTSRCSAARSPQRLVTQMYFPGDPLFALRPDLQSIPDRDGARAADLALRPRRDRARVGAGLPLGHRAARPATRRRSRSRR